MALKPWNELPVAVRRSKARLYEYVRTGGESESESESESDDSETTTYTGTGESMTMEDGEL